MSIFFDFVRTSLLRSKKLYFLTRISKNASFWLLLLKENLWEKGRFFDKNYGLTPLQNADFFYFARVSLFRSEKHSLLSRISKYVSFLLVCLKEKHKRRRSNFSQKPWLTPSQNVDILEFFRTFFVVYKAFFSIQNIKKCFFLAFFAEKKIWGKGGFFDKNHGLTPLENADFFFFARVSLFRSKKHSLLSRISKNVSFLLCLPTKKHIRTRSNFCKKPCTNPFGKCTFLWIC